MDLDDRPSREDDIVISCDVGHFVLLKFISSKCLNILQYVGVIDNIYESDFEGRFIKRKLWDELLRKDLSAFQEDESSFLKNGHITYIVTCGNS